MRDQPVAAVYYPPSTWTDGSWLTTALLFVDQIALFTRHDGEGLPAVVDPVVGEPLAERGLLRLLSPQALVDAEVRERLRGTLSDQRVVRALEPIGRDARFYYGRRVYDTLNGPEPSIEMMELRNALFAALQAGATVRGEAGGDPTLPVHARVWAPLLAAAPQILRGRQPLGEAQPAPITDSPRSASALRALLTLDGMPSARRTVALEAFPVCLHLAAVPLGEALDFRQQHGHAYRSYAAALRSAASQISLADPADRDKLRMESVEELADRGDQLRRVARQAFADRQLPTFSLGLVGAAWTDEDRGSARLQRLGDALAGTAPPAAGGRYESFTYVFMQAAALSAPQGRDGDERVAGH